MLTLVHSTLGTLVIVLNLLSSLWLALLDRAGRAPAGHAITLLWAARLSLALQLGLGLALVAQGYVGMNLHYVGALAAATAAWLTGQRARRAARPARALALGQALVGLLALGAYLAGRAT